MKTTHLKLMYFYVFCFFCLYGCSAPTIDDLIPNESSTKKNITENPQSSTTNNDFLDYGIYWFNANNESHKGFSELLNEPINVSLDLYNPSQPTVIYFHGWATGSSENNYQRENFKIINDRLDLNVNTITAWKEKGWNVAIFYWNQFGDEDEVTDAEAKIWSTEGPEKMRYRLSNGTYSDLQSPKNNVSQIAFNQLSSVLADNSSENIRMVGHSLGSQLAVNVAHLISEAVKSGELSISLMPNRIELLDPFWSKGAKSFLSDFDKDRKKAWTGERVRSYINEMKQANNTVFTWYKSSAILNLGIGDGNEKLKQEVAFQSFRSWYLNSFNLIDKHIYVRHNYFWSMSFNAPKEVKQGFLNKKTNTGNVSASASTPDTRIRELMDSGYLWDQVEGRNTATPDDNQFQIKSW